jgi:hypothetical protein
MISKDIAVEVINPYYEHNRHIVRACAFTI